jgi:hypothetical protein
MFDNKEVAARHLPVAHGPDASGRRSFDGGAKTGRPRASSAPSGASQRRHASGTRLQATVVVDHERDDGDPYADVPCTD